MKRVLSLVLALVLVLGMIPTFAAEKTGGEELKALGLLSGNENGDLMEDQTLERQEFAKIIAQLNGALDEAAAYVTPGTFADFDKVEGWAKPYVAYAEEQGWMTGKTGNIFDPAAELKSQELLVVLLRVLGYDDTWSKAFETAAEVGLVAEEITAITRGDAFELIWTAVSEVKMADSDMTLGVHLGVLEPEVVVNEIAIKSVVADNARQVKVTFNQPVDEETLVAANVKIYVGSSTTATTWTAFVDGDVVTFGLSADVPQDTDVKVVIKDVIGANDKNEVKMTEVSTTVRMKDVTSPKILTVAASTSKTFTFTASEPLKIADSELVFHVLQNITVDGLKLVGKITPNYANNTFTVELGTKLAVGNHTIAVTGLKDIVGFAADTFNGSITVIEDKTAPTVVAVTYVDRNNVKVKFDEPVASAGTITIDGFATTIGAANSTKTEYAVTITAPNKLGLASVVRSIVSYVGSTDMEGNVVTTAKTFEFTATDDLVAPTATISVNAANKVKVVFSETMSAPGTLTVKNANGAIVNVGALSLDATDTTNKTYVSASAVAQTAGTYTVELKDSKDNGVRENTIVTTTATVTTLDITAPTISQVLFKSAYAASPLAYGKAVIYFSEAMDVATITNLANYLVDVDGGAPFTPVQLSTVTGAAASASADAKSVVLTIPGASFAAGVTQIAVLAVKDAAGNLIATADFNAPEVVAASAPALAIDTTVAGYQAPGYYLVAKNKIEMTFTNALASVDPSNFNIYTGDGTSPSLVGVAYELSADAKTVTITLNGNLTTDAKVSGDTTGTARLRVVSGNTKDIFGSAFATPVDLTNPALPVYTYISLVDYVAPTISVATGTNVGEIVITFSETVNLGANLAALANDLIIRDHLGNVVTLGANISYGTGTVNATKTIVFTDAAATGKTYTVQFVGRNAVDANANLVPSLAATSVVVK